MRADFGAPAGQVCVTLAAVDGPRKLSDTYRGGPVEDRFCSIDGRMRIDGTGP